MKAKLVGSMPVGAWIYEIKFDGYRALALRAGRETRILSRNEKDLGSKFPAVRDSIASLDVRDVIIDGEIVALDEKGRSSFQLLQDIAQEKAPIVYYAFDLLRLNGETLLKKPLSERRRRLSQLILPDRVKVSPIREIASIKDIDEAYQQARHQSQEGLMIKDPDSLYTPGTRGGSWIKFKKELATLDVVIVGVEQGHGKRSHVLSDYTFSVRDEETGALQTIGKAYSGLQDEEIEELTEHFLRTTIRKERHFREVTPEIVLEVAFDSVQPSDRHASGLALRFPRIKSIRRDKKVQEIDTVQYARQFVRQV